MIDLAVPCRNCGKRVDVRLPEFGDTLSPEAMADESMADVFKRWIWTTEPPTVEGWYWGIHLSGGLVMVKVNDGYMVFLEKTDRMEEPHFSIPESFTHWLGPLPIPEPPKE